MLATIMFASLMALIALGMFLLAYFPWWLPINGPTRELVVNARRKHLHLISNRKPAPVCTSRLLNNSPSGKAANKVSPVRSVRIGGAERLPR